jgi:hypothetical protein
MLGGEWNQDELVQLLEGLEQFGYGNWTDVACYVDTKNPTECRNAANQYFVNGKKEFMRYIIPFITIYSTNLIYLCYM